MPVSSELLGAQYREAKASIAVHRRRQASVTIEHHRLARTPGADPDAVAAAWGLVLEAHADVQWCIACTVAAGEAYKGMTLDDAIAAGLADRRNLPAPPVEG